MRRNRSREPRLRGRELIEVRRATARLLGDDAALARDAGDVARVFRAADPAAVLDLWDFERVPTLAVHRARELGLQHRDWDERAEDLRQLSAARAGVFELVAIQVTKRLAADGIPAVLLKGSPLAERLHGDASLRFPSADVDVLVPTADLFRAAELLETQGWTAPSDVVFGNGLPKLHLSLGSHGAPPVELHWRVQLYDDHEHATGLLDRAITHRGISVLDPVDLLDLLLLCWARDGFHTLRLGADIAAWFRVYGDEVPEAWRERLWSGRPMARAARTAAHAAAAVFGTPAPPAPLATRGERLSVKIALTDMPRSERSGGFAQRVLLNLLVSPPEQRPSHFASMWLPDPRQSAAIHPWAPPAAIPALRALSGLQTAAQALPIVARAALRAS